MGLAVGCGRLDGDAGGLGGAGVFADAAACAGGADFDEALVIDGECVEADGAVLDAAVAVWGVRVVGLGRLLTETSGVIHGREADVDVSMGID
jgi:hypothetical protein